MLNLLFYLLLQLGLLESPSTPKQAPATLQTTTTQSLDASLQLESAPLDITIGSEGGEIGGGGWDDKN